MNVHTMAAFDSDKRKVLDGLVSEVRQAFLDDHTILSFGEYFDLVLD